MGRCTVASLTTRPLLQDPASCGDRRYMPDTPRGLYGVQWLLSRRAPFTSTQSLCCVLFDMGRGSGTRPAYEKRMRICIWVSHQDTTRHAHAACPHRTEGPRRSAVCCVSGAAHLARSTWCDVCVCVCVCMYIYMCVYAINESYRGCVHARPGRYTGFSIAWCSPRRARLQPSTTFATAYSPAFVPCSAIRLHRHQFILRVETDRTHCCDIHIHIYI